MSYQNCPNCSTIIKESKFFTGSTIVNTGGEKGMLMVCMAGAAIKLQNTSTLQQGQLAMLKLLEAAKSKLLYYTLYKKLANTI